MNSTITVIGAGPIGLIAARHLAEAGMQVTVLEEHAKVGKPMQCAGLISKSGAAINKLPVKECTLNEIQGARIFAPNGEMLSVHKYETVALVIDREKFDLECLKEAEKLGVEVKAKCKLIDLRSDTVFYQHEERGEIMKTKIAIGADGAGSKSRSLLGMQQPSTSFINAYQIRAKGSFEKEFVELYFGSFAEGFFAWKIPESKSIARIGIGTTMQKNAQQALEEFLQKKSIQVEKIEESAGLIPIGQPLKETVKGNALLIGDAAFQTKATTGGGIITGSVAARLASEAVIENQRHRKPLKSLDKNLSALNKDLQIHWKIRKYLNSLNEDSLNKLFVKLKNAKIDQFLEKYGNMDHPSLFAGKLLGNPKMWFLLPEVINALR